MNNNKKLKEQFGQTETLEGMISGLTRTANSNVISGQFNQKTLYQMALDAYNRDLPARLQLERQIKALNRVLSALESAACHDLPSLALA